MPNAQARASASRARGLGHGVGVAGGIRPSERLAWQTRKRRMLCVVMGEMLAALPFTTPRGNPWTVPWVGTGWRLHGLYLRELAKAPERPGDAD